MDAQSIEFVVCNSDPFENPDLHHYNLIVRPISDFKTYRKSFLEPKLTGKEKEEIIIFEKINILEQDPSIPENNQSRKWINPIGYPHCLPKSSQPLPDGPLVWWHSLIIRSRCIRDIFREDAGIVFELYKNRILELNQEEKVTPRPPVAIGELRLSYIEREILSKLSNGVRITEIEFPKLFMDQKALPNLTIGIRLVPKNQKKILNQKTMESIQSFRTSEINALYQKETEFLLQWNNEMETGMIYNNVTTVVFQLQCSNLNITVRIYNSLYLDEKQKKMEFDVGEEVMMLLKGGRISSSESLPVLQEIKKPRDKHEIALIDLSRDFLSLKQIMENLEDENVKLRSEIKEIRLKEAEKRIFIEKGLQHSHPREMAHKYSKIYIQQGSVIY